MRRRLEDEPLLAARIVVEDCLNLLLDVDDIDRLWAASGGVPSSSSHQQQQQQPQQRDSRGALRQRRSLLLEVSAILPGAISVVVHATMVGSAAW